MQPRSRLTTRRGWLQFILQRTFREIKRIVQNEIEMAVADHFRPVKPEMGINRLMQS